MHFIFVGFIYLLWTNILFWIFKVFRIYNKVTFVTKIACIFLAYSYEVIGTNIYNKFYDKKNVLLVLIDLSKDQVWGNNLTKEKWRIRLHTDACPINVHQNGNYLPKFRVYCQTCAPRMKDSAPRIAVKRSALKEKRPAFKPSINLLDLILKYLEMFDATLYRSIHHNGTFWNRIQMSATTYSFR